MSKGILACAALLALPVFAGAAQPRAGLGFLKIGAGARPAGMGSAFTALADDATSLYWNPAGLGRVGRRELSLSHSQWLLNSQYAYMGYAQPSALGTLGVGFSRLSHPEQEGRGANRERTSGFGAADTALTLGVGRAVFPRVHLGAGVKLIQSEIGSDAGRSYAVDLGGLYKPPSLPVTLGLSVRNLGPGVRYASATEPLPLTFAVGAGFSLLGVSLAADVTHQPQDKATDVSVGMEYRLIAPLALRAGLQNLGTVGTTGTNPLFPGFGGGFGLTMQSYQLDYAVTPFGTLGNAQRLSLSAKF